MKEAILEFRGINRYHLMMYAEELGGKQATSDFPILYQGADWSIELLEETEITFTSTFKVNAVKIRFIGESQAVLEDLIKRYRYKTTRVGG